MQLIVYGYYGYKLANLRNIYVEEWNISEEDVKEFKSFRFSFVVMTNLLMALSTFYSTTIGLYLAFKCFSDGKILLGILIIVFGIAIIIWLLNYLFAFVSGILMAILRIDKKYF